MVRSMFVELLGRTNEGRPETREGEGRGGGCELGRTRRMDEEKWEGVGSAPKEESRVGRSGRDEA